MPPGQPIYPTGSGLVEEHFMVDPRQALPGQIGHSGDGKPETNITRTASKRRRPNYADSTTLIEPWQHRESPPPLAPEVPPSSSYERRTSQMNEASHHSMNGHPESFARRAASLTRRTNPPISSPNDDMEAAELSAHRDRRTSLTGPTGGLESQGQQTKRDFMSQDFEDKPSRRASNPQTYERQPKRYEPATQRRAFSQHVSDGTKPANPESDYGTQHAVVPEQVQRDSFAADRSPLQRLEVKLGGFSKEDKRARAETAERRLRESQLREEEARVHTKSNVVSGGSISKRHTLSQSHTDQSNDEMGSPNEIRGTTGSSRRFSQDARRQSTEHNRDANLRASGYRETHVDTTQPTTVHLDSNGRPAESVDGFRQESLGRPYIDDHDGIALPHKKKAIRDQRLSYQTRATAGNNHRYAQVQHANADRTPSGALKDQSTPKGTSRPRVGFSSHNDLKTQQPGSQTLRNILRPGHHKAFPAPKVDATHTSFSNEWRNGAVARLAVSDFSEDFKEDQPWWERKPSSGRRRSAARETQKSEGFTNAPVCNSFTPPLYLECGPLLRYTGMKRDRVRSEGKAGPQSAERETWRGSVMIVTTDADSEYDPAPVLRLFSEPMEKVPGLSHTAEVDRADELPVHYLDPVAGMPTLSRTGSIMYVKPVDDLQHSKDLSHFETNDDGLFEDFRTAAVPTAYGTPEYRPGQTGTAIQPGKQNTKARRGHHVKGVRLYQQRGLTFWRFNLEVELQPYEMRVAYSINNSPAIGFWVPGRNQSMNVMFHSCNGFSLSVNPDDFSGPDPLWRDVLNKHQTQPFHVMIGGGDQIYNDAVMEKCPLFSQWLDIKNPHHKHEAAFSGELEQQLDEFYLENYAMWFSRGMFGMANAQIPMVNMWDDHDIIDGFGSYPDHFMRSPVFRGLGAIAFKYYMLFQHQSVPEETASDEPSWLLGLSDGPYVAELSRSIYLSLGKRVAFLGLDCRTERTRSEIVSEATYHAIFDRCRREIYEGETKHLVVLLGVPIAYPRLVWLENILTSRALDPIKALGRAGLLGGFLNKFDGGVEILDDLDDHWTAKNHKQERNWFIQELQEIAAEKSVRVTILGGDVHLAAIGHFYSSPKLNIPKDKDHRYMANVISSAIVNTPPPAMMSDILNKRNKIHHLDHETDENMIPMFSHDVDGSARNNKRLLPRRNWCSIREYEPGDSPPPTPPPSEPDSFSDDEGSRPSRLQRTLSLTREDVKPRKLIRRLSGGREARPSSQPKSSEVDPLSMPDSNRTQDHSLRQSQSANQPLAQANDRSMDASTDSASTQRPGKFLRRPTNLSDKAATRGDLENDSSGHINLQHGLDIVLNCEIDQKNPAGSTRPYRLLVPALFYDGHGDFNTLAYRKKSVLRRLGSLRSRQTQKVDATPEQEDRDKDTMSFSQSITESEEDADLAQPNRPRRWSFGLEKRRRYRNQSPLPLRHSQEIRRSSHTHPHQGADLRGPSSMQPSQGLDMPAPRQARKFETFVDDQDSDNEEARPHHNRLDSIDYHANIPAAQTTPATASGGRRLSKVDRMLGTEIRGPPVSTPDDAFTRSDALRPAPQPNAPKPESGGIYSEKDKKGWRRSLQMFF